MTPHDELRRLAEAAGAHEWRWMDQDGYYHRLETPEGQIVMDDGSACGEYGATISPDDVHGQYIAAANPARILALLDEVEALKEAIMRIHNIPGKVNAKPGAVINKMQQAARVALSRKGSTHD